MKFRGRGNEALWLVALTYASVGFSIYFALGVVAKRGLGLTPLIFLAAGLLFVLTMFTYIEGSAMLRERGGSSAFARHAYNELIAFVAGWVILLDYLIVIALAVLSVPHYLEPITGNLDGTLWATAISAGVLIYITTLNVLDIPARRRPRLLIGLAGWYFVVFRGQQATALHWAALPYALLLASTAGLASGLALQARSFIPLALGGALFLTSDLILAAQLFNGLSFFLVGSVVWLTYGPAQALIVYTAQNRP